MFQVGELRSRGSYTPWDMQLIHKLFGVYRKQQSEIRTSNIKSTLRSLDLANATPRWSQRFLSGRGDISKRIQDKLRSW